MSPETPLEGVIFYLVVEQFLTDLGCNFGTFLEPKSSKNEVQKSLVKRDDFHVTLWASWGWTGPEERGLLPARIPPSM